MLEISSAATDVASCGSRGSQLMIRVYEQDLNLGIYFGILGLFGDFFRIFGFFLYRILGLFSEFVIFWEILRFVSDFSDFFGGFWDYILGFS